MASRFETQELQRGRLEDVSGYETNLSATDAPNNQEKHNFGDITKEQQERLIKLIFAGIPIATIALIALNFLAK